MTDNSQEMLRFLRETVIDDPEVEISQRTALVSTGIVDSFSLIEILLHLEQVTNRKISASDACVDDFETVDSMLQMAHRVGTPR